MRFGVLFFVLLLAACVKDPISRQVTDNANVQLSLLFSHEGCSIYRFSDAGELHYFADCRNSVSNVTHHGKGRTTEDSL